MPLAEADIVEAAIRRRIAVGADGVISLDGRSSLGAAIKRTEVMLAELLRRHAAGREMPPASALLEFGRDGEGIHALILLVEVEEVVELFEGDQLISPVFINKVKSTHWVRLTAKGEALLNARLDSAIANRGQR